MAEVLDKLLVEAFHANSKLLGEVAGRFLGELFQQGLQLGICRGVSDSRLQFEERAVSRVRVVGDLEWEIHIGVIPGEARREDSDYCVVLMDKLKGAADYSRVAIEMPL